MADQIHRHKIGFLLGLAAILCLGPGCLKVKEHLTLRADGSGTLTIEAQSVLPPEAMSSIRSSRAENPWLCYPPLTKEDAQQLFAGGQFTVKTKESKGEAGYAGLTTEVEFKDVNDLLGSPYGRAHSMEIAAKGDALTFTALCGLEGAALLGDAEGLEWMTDGLGVRELRRRKGEMSVHFKVTLPGKIGASNGKAENDGVEWTVDWPTLEKAVKAAGATGGKMSATCALDGIRFTPAGPPRPGLVRFNDLKAGPGGGKQAGPDEKKVLQSARFVPLFLRMERCFDLTGAGYGEARSMGVLNGWLLVPPEILPQRCGAAAVEEVIDDSGNDLQFHTDPTRRYPIYNFRLYAHMAASDMGPAQPYPVTLLFKAPGRETKEIARIKASIGLYYPTGMQVVKLAKPIGSELIADERSGGGNRLFESQSLDSPELAKLGLSVALSYAMRSGNMIRLGMSITGQSSVVSHLQVYDADGAPWPSLAHTSMSGEEGSSDCHVMIPGKPKAPLSLALLVNTTGRAVKVPIAMQHVPLSSPAAGPAKEK